MTRTLFFAPTAALLSFALLAGCGTNMEQRAATGAATGLVVAGPVGAAVGAGGEWRREGGQDEGKNACAADMLRADVKTRHDYKLPALTGTGF